VRMASHQFPQLRVMLLVYGQGPSHLPHDCISMFSLGRIGLSFFCLHPLWQDKKVGRRPAGVVKLQLLLKLSR
ncbi:hypothetical protein RA280_24435, partial [Cupriavidus sp. CV2]|uniref:hypothetical protein n=1 Tax=Cupriavidus ulmosensis TaxID=3065913 RepID=UPI00296B4B76